MEPKAAVDAAYKYLLEASPNSEKFSNFKLEEIKKDTTGNFLLTLSYDAIGDYAFAKERVFKDFKVLVDGKIEYMKIRKV